jgi:hypothetical protein
MKFPLLFLLALLPAAAQAERLLANSAALASPKDLALAEGRTSTIFTGEKGRSQFNLHSYLVHFNGQFFAAWSSAAGNEEDPDQQILFATSRDGHTWSEARVLAADPDGAQGPQRWIARGLFVRNGKLHALGARVASADYGKRGKAVVWKDLQLIWFEWNGTRWNDKGVFAPNCMNNFPPERLGGRLFMPCRDENMDLFAAYADPARPAQWSYEKLAAPPPFEQLDEPSWFTGPDGVAHLIIRDNRRSRRLIHMFSRDNGATWSPAVQTNYPDATSKNYIGRLSTGAYYLVNNPNPAGRDPLAISFSRDGWTFDYPMAIRHAAPAARFKQRTGTFQYPHAIEHNGSLWVAYSTNKEDIQITEIPVKSTPRSFDVVVYGATPGGIGAAISAARLGRRVALVEYHNHVGGMSASGLGKSDIETREAIGGLFREFTGHVRDHYVEHYGAGSANARLSRDGYYYEPSVAERILRRMIGKEGERITLFPRRELRSVTKAGERITALTARHRATLASEEFRAPVFIDATYEGDLAAAAGARYRLGREGRAEFGEKHAGVIYQDHDTREFLPGSTGEGDKRLPAYTFRLCLTTDPANAYVLTEPPAGYRREDYLGYLDDWREGRMGMPANYKDGRGMFKPLMGTAVRALSVAELPNAKTDVNMFPKALGFPFAGRTPGMWRPGGRSGNELRAKIRNLTLGLLYFLQNDEAIPEEHRRLARGFQLARDEFAAEGHFPWQLYIREARRIAGMYTLSENDVTLRPGEKRAAIHSDAIASGEFPIDSFPTRKREPGQTKALEGYIYMLDDYTVPYQIPYRILVPEKVDGLLVPVAASTTHVAFSTIRMEPTWMAMGEAAGAAAHLAIGAGVMPRGVDVDALQRHLAGRGQVLTYFKDIDRGHAAYAAMQYFGTKGFFEDYLARPDEPLDGATAARWQKLAGVTVDVPAGITRGAFCQRLYERR